MSSYSDLMNKFTNDYIREFGERRLRKIRSKVTESRGVQKYLVKLQEVYLSPHFEDLTVVVMNMPFFMVANKETVTMASLILLEIWNTKLNANNKLLSDYELERLAIQVISNCSSMA